MNNPRPDRATYRCATTIAMFTLLALILAGTIGQLIITLRTAAHPPNLTCPVPTLPPAVPCAAIPLKFIEQEPRCADELLHIMNVTNLHIVSYEDRFPKRHPNATDVAQS